MAKYFFFISVLLLQQLSIKAQDKIATDRPDQTELATLTPLHYFQAEFGFTHESFGKDYDNIYPNFLFKYGLTKNFELRLQDQVITHYEQLTPKPTTTTGFEPLEIGFRVALFEQKKFIPKTSLITQAAIPTFASKGLEADHLAPKVFFAMENDITKKINVGYNLGAEWDGFSIDPYWLYTLSCGFELSEKWETYVEVFGKAINHGQPENGIDGGFAYYISNDVKADASAGFGVSKAASNYYMSVGFSFRVK